MKVSVIALASVTMFAASAYAFSPAVRSSMSRAAFGVRSPFSSAAAGAATASPSKLNMAIAPAPVDFVKQEIANNDVVVFSKSYCPFCTATKGLMQDLSIDAKVIELDEVDNGDAIQAALLETSGQRTVPNVFVKGQHLGGNDDTQSAAKSGKLQEMLQ